MHENSINLMNMFIDRHITSTSGSVLDVGSMNINGTYRDQWNGWDYTGIDISEGLDVDIVVSGNGIWDLHKQFDVVISGSTLEHVRCLFQLVNTIGQHLRKDGFLFFCAPFQWGIHNYPNDYWRFCPDGMGELCRLADCEVLEANVSGLDAYVFGRKLTPSRWDYQGFCGERVRGSFG